MSRHYFVRSVRQAMTWTYAYIDGWKRITWQATPAYACSVPTLNEAIHAVIHDRNREVRAECERRQERIEVISIPKEARHPGLTRDHKVEWSFRDIITAIGSLEEIDYQPPRPATGSLSKRLRGEA